MLEAVFLVFKHAKSFKEKLKKWLESFIRIAPFFLLFYKWFVEDGDQRANQISLWLKALFQGDWYKTYSFFTGLGNIILPNEVFFRILTFFENTFHFGITEKRIVFVLLTVIMIFIVKLVIRKELSLKWGTAFAIVAFIFLQIAKNTFAYPGLIGGLSGKISAFTGVYFALVALILLKIFSIKEKSIFLLSWIIFNLSAYASYQPIFDFPSDNRYLLHSFLPFVGLLAIWFVESWNNRFKKKWIYLIIGGLIIAWGGMNFLSNILSLKQIIKDRANPSKRFFTQLKNYYPSFPKGSIFYFYIPDKPLAHVHYDAGFGVAQMPDETAIAWRYGFDRYDLTIVNTFSDLTSKINEKEISVDKIYTFIVDSDNLIDTTNQTRKLLTLKKKETEKKDLFSQIEINKGTVNKITIKPLVVPLNALSLTPLKVTMLISAMPIDKNVLSFPLKVDVNGEQGGAVLDKNLRQQLLNYRKWKEQYLGKTKIWASSSWREFLPKLLLDGNNNTYWEADRFSWEGKNESVTVDLGQEVLIGAVFYRNGPHALTPTEFEIDISLDNNNYTPIEKVIVNDLSQRDEIQKVNFEKVKARFVKIIFTKTLYDEAPGWSELEIVPDEFSNINPLVAQRFFRQPFSQVESSLQWEELISGFKGSGLVKLSWKNDSDSNIVSAPESTFPLVYDGSARWISFIIPAGGMNLEKIEILPITIPGILEIFQINYENLNMSDIKKMIMTSSANLSPRFPRLNEDDI